MIRSLLDLIFNFVLQIQINTLSLSHNKRLPQPYSANRVSQLVSKLLEKNWIRGFFGANLATAMITLPLLVSDQPEVVYEPPLNIARADLIIPDSTFVITTQTREYVLPVENLRYVGQGFRSSHPALDLNSFIDDPVKAFTAGRVHQTQAGIFGLGKYIILDHGHGLTSVYAHLKDTQVETGQTVETGEQIGTVGMTGYTTGPHLHFEVHDSGRAINPLHYLDI